MIICKYCGKEIAEDYAEDFGVYFFHIYTDRTQCENTILKFYATPKKD